MDRNINNFFIEKYIGYTLVIKPPCTDDNEDTDSKYYDIDFYIKDSKVNYPGFANKADRDYIDYIIMIVGINIVTDYEIDKDNKKIFIEIRG